MLTEQNRANHRRFIEEAWNKGNPAVIDEIASPDLVAHFLPPGTPRGGEGMKRQITSFRAAFPDVRVIVEEQVAEGDKTVMRWTMTGTHRGPFLNQLKTLMPPTGKQFSARGIDIWRYDSDGKWIECSSSFDRLGFLEQLGAIPAAVPISGDASASAPPRPYTADNVASDSQL